MWISEQVLHEAEYTRVFTAACEWLGALNLNDKIKTVWVESGIWEFYMDYNYEDAIATVCAGNEYRLDVNNLGVSSMKPVHHSCQHPGM